MNIFSDNINYASINHNTDTPISDYNSETSNINNNILKINNNYCYEAICSFQGMIKEDFQVKIDKKNIEYFDEKF